MLDSMKGALPPNENEKIKLSFNVPIPRGGR